MTQTRRILTPKERVLTALNHREADRVPFFLPFTMYGAKELGISIKEYFSRPDYVVEGQFRLQKKFGHDALNATFFAGLEMEAWGGEVIYYDDGPPNAGAPIIEKLSDIENLTPPKISETPCLQRVLETIKQIKARAGDDLPIFCMVLSPFSAPVIQMGFDRYIEIMYEQPELFNALMRVNEAFAIDWAKAQLAAGADSVCYFDPLSSPNMTNREKYLETGFEIAKRVISRVANPTAVHLASARCLPFIDHIAAAGARVIGVGCEEDLADVKAACQGKLCILGNLNGLAMRRWTAPEAEAAVKDAIRKAGPGGGYILADSHGEIPYQVPEEVLLAISEAVQRWGVYPLDIDKD